MPGRNGLGKYQADLAADEITALEKVRSPFIHYQLHRLTMGLFLKPLRVRPPLHPQPRSLEELNVTLFAQIVCQNAAQEDVLLVVNTSDMLDNSGIICSIFQV